MVAMSIAWGNMFCGRFGGIGMIPTKCVGDFEDQLGSWRSSSGKASKRLLKVVSFVSRKTTGRRLSEQPKVLN